MGFAAASTLSMDPYPLDLAFAAGISRLEPDGWSPRDAPAVIQHRPRTFVAADVVESNPTPDPLGRTTMDVAKFVKELAARMTEKPV
jgi:arginase family enzyme